MSEGWTACLLAMQSFEGSCLLARPQCLQHSLCSARHISKYICCLVVLRADLLCLTAHRHTILLHNAAVSYY